MKIFLLPIMLCLLVRPTAHAQRTVSINANFNSGVGEQRGKYDNMYGLGTTFEFPFKNLSAVHFTTAFDAGINGIKSMPVQLDFNGSSTKTDVNYTNYAFRLTPGLKYLVRENRKWSPYTALSVGLMSYYTEMSIRDPQDPRGCSPLQRKTVSFSLLVMGMAETGIRIKTKKKSEGSISSIEIGGGYLLGSRAKYLQLSEQHTSESDEEEFMIKFKQNSTGIIHEHMMGTMHRTTTHQLMFHVSVAFAL